jgi:hypothetical protein
MQVLLQLEPIYQNKVVVLNGMSKDSTMGKIQRHSGVRGLLTELK